MSQRDKVALLIMVLLGLTLLITVFAAGKNIALFNPKGLIAHEQRSLMVFTVALLFVIGIPAIFLAFFTAWKYRESNKKAKYAPDTHHSRFFDLSLWLIPTVFMVVLAFVTWNSAHKLEPQKSLATDTKPLTIQVVAMRWKWLFIYPEQDIATVNFVQIPEHTPVQFELTADEAPMSSFWIPNLGGQLYAMTGMVNRLNLMADTPGDYQGMSAEINGAGFSGMKFVTRVSSGDDFDAWVQKVNASPIVLDAKEYQRIVQPSENQPVLLYSSSDKDLYDTVVMKYMNHAEESMHTQTHNQIEDHH